MNDYQPKVGDRVMVGEHGPYTVTALSGEDSEYVQVEIPTEMPRKFRGVLPAWLTPAPEPEPDEPTAPGALVRDGNGAYWFRRGAAVSEYTWFSLAYGQVRRWEVLTRPITVVLADPAEVETLRSQRDALFAQRDELQRRIDAALRYLSGSPVAQRTASILRGES